jgi:hypothetical protein
MCSYACIGCGRCGKPRTMVVPPIICLRCGIENEPGAPECRACGNRFAPGPATVVPSAQRPSNNA